MQQSNPKVFADLMWEVEYSAWLGHKPEAEGKTLADFKDLVAKAKAGDQVAQEAITYETWLNDFDDDKGYKPLLVTVCPLIGGGWKDGVLQPDETRVVVVDTREVENITMTNDFGSGFSFNYMVRDGRLIEVIYISGVYDGIDWSQTELNLSINLALTSEMAERNNGKKWPRGNGLSDVQEAVRVEIAGAMELKK